MTRKRRVYYVASVPVDSLNAKLGHKHHVGAATNKVFGVSAALRSAGVLPIVLSGIYAQRYPWTTSTEYFRVRRSIYARIYTFGSAAVRRAIFSLSLCSFFLRKFSKDQIVIFYNYYPDYILPAILLKILGRSAILDIEDGPRPDEPGLRALSNRIALHLLKRLCADRYLTVSHDLGRQMSLSNYMPVHGVIVPHSNRSPSRKRFTGNEVRVLFGGSIEQATGLSVFVAAVRDLASRPLATRFKFFVTGLFSASDFERLLIDVAESSTVDLTLCPGLTATEYTTLLEGMDVGLSLRLTQSSLGLTTFPSKAIEYTSLGLLLCTTPSPGISEIYSDNQALILEDDSPLTLVNAMVGIAASPGEAAMRAIAGQRRCHEVFSSELVGRRLLNFLAD